MSKWRDWSDDLIDEQESLISRGVRPLAWLGDVPADEADSCFSRLRNRPYSSGSAIPFVLPVGDGSVTVAGFAAEPWVVDTLGWLFSGGIPDRMFHLVLGLLLGYSPGEIGKHDLCQFAGSPGAIPRTPIPLEHGDTPGLDTSRTRPQP